MRTIIAYPVPFDNWSTFAPFVERFTRTFKEHPPGTSDYELWAMAQWGEPTDAIKSMFHGIKTRFMPQFIDGCDIGGAQWLASLDKNPMILAMTTRCYFHRKGWLERYAAVRAKHGPGLYGASVSNEGGKLHVCTRAYAMDAALWLQYPHAIDTREKGQRFEVGDWCVTDFVRQTGGAIRQVTWDSDRPVDDARNPQETDIFRRGSQAAMLVWDKHSDAYAAADADQKKRLESLADIPQVE